MTTLDSTFINRKAIIIDHSASTNEWDIQEEISQTSDSPKLLLRHTEISAHNTKNSLNNSGNVKSEHKKEFIKELTIMLDCQKSK
jgi:hypothetical protein